MTRFHQKYSTPPFPMSKICRSLLATCVVAAGAPVVVQAQETEQVIEEVVVRGARASLRNARALRRLARAPLTTTSSITCSVSCACTTTGAPAATTQVASSDRQIFDIGNGGVEYFW